MVRSPQTSVLPRAVTLLTGLLLLALLALPTPSSAQRTPQEDPFVQITFLNWTSAEPDEELRRRRLAEAQDVLDQLKTRDPGGDVVL